MRKIRILVIVLATSFALITCTLQSVAQEHTLEFKGGVIATSTRNNSCEGKTILDTKLGLSVGGAFLWNFFDGHLRAAAEGFYTLQGEEYTMDGDDGKFKSDVCYFKVAPNIRYYTPYVPIYVGAGFYFGVATTREVYTGDLLDQSHEWSFKKYYKPIDFGGRAALGTEIGVSNVKFMMEAAYEYGLTDISNRKEREIKNQSVTVSLGISFEIAGKHYRHY